MLGGNTYTFDIVLTNIVIPTMTADMNIVVLPGLGSYGDEVLSTGKQSATLHLTGNLSAYGLEFKGPYYYNGREIKDNKLYVSTSSFKYPYFNITALNVDDSSFDIDAIKDAVRSGLKFRGVTSGSVKDATGTEIYSGSYRESIIKTELEYSSGGGGAYVELLTNWLGNYEGKASDPQYTVYIDNSGPTGEVHAVTSETSTLYQTTLGSTTYDIVARKDIKLDVGGVSDAGSGIYRIHVFNESTSLWETREILSNRYVDWTLSNTNATQQIKYYLEDNSGNITGSQTTPIILNVMYNGRSSYK